jgi:hypothetical protein
MENYGYRWKFKGGEDYFYALGDAGRSDEALAELVQALRTRIEWDNEGSRNYMVGYAVVEDSFMTDYEKSQLEYDGRVAYPAVMLLPLEEVEHAYYGA